MIKILEHTTTYSCKDCEKSITVTDRQIPIVSPIITWFFEAIAELVMLFHNYRYHNRFNILKLVRCSILIVMQKLLMFVLLLICIPFDIIIYTITSLLPFLRRDRYLDE